jgi:hypothetical protein
MKHWMMALEYRGNSREGAIALTQRRDLGNGKMFPGNQSEGQRHKRAQHLRDKDNVFSAKPIRQMAGWQGQRHHRDCDNEANEPERSCRMGKPINLPFHRHGQHQTASNREQITSRKQAEIPEPEGCVRIMPSRLSFERQRNGWALLVRR